MVCGSCAQGVTVDVAVRDLCDAVVLLGLDGDRTRTESGFCPGCGSEIFSLTVAESELSPRRITASLTLTAQYNEVLDDYVYPEPDFTQVMFERWDDRLPVVDRDNTTYLVHVHYQYDMAKTDPTLKDQVYTRRCGFVDVKVRESAPNWDALHRNTQIGEWGDTVPFPLRKASRLPLRVLTSDRIGPDTPCWGHAIGYGNKEDYLDNVDEILVLDGERWPCYRPSYWPHRKQLNIENPLVGYFSEGEV